MECIENYNILLYFPLNIKILIVMDTSSAGSIYKIHVKLVVPGARKSTTISDSGFGGMHVMLNAIVHIYELDILKKIGT